jgi:hypothetical protein
MVTIIIENVGSEDITCVEVSQNSLPAISKPIVINAGKEKTVQVDSPENQIRIKISAGYHPDWCTEKEKDRSTMPKPKLF